jgi:iron(II)-dependent oxidoreductase
VRGGLAAALLGAAVLDTACVVACGAALAQAPEMVEVAAGSFTMGRDDGPVDERPAHRVEVAGFLVDRLPVTHAQFAGFLQAQGLHGEFRGRAYGRYDDEDGDARIHRVDGRWRADPGLEHHPVNEVSWAGARDYCAWLGKRLPTEAEWEKAARGGDARLYPWGNAAPDATRAKFAAGWTQTAAVDAYPAGASPYGALDMAGNQWEWVSSLYRPYPYRADDGREDVASAEVRGTRGGGHDSPAAELTSTQRGRTLSRAPRAGHHNIGFRCAK